MFTNRQILIIEGELPDLNQYQNACRTHWAKGAEMKRDAGYIVELEAKKQKLVAVNNPCFITYNWFCKNKRKDKSNISAMGRKVIEDGLQQAGILKQDNWDAISGFSDLFSVDKDNPRIEVIIDW